MADLKRLDDMSTEERVAFLETLAESLLMSASIAKHEDDPLWEDLAKLGNRLQMDAETIATDDPERAESVVRDAIHLLAKFEHGSGGSHTIH
ncbi:MULTISPECIES: hypothetical protein [unclassified Rhizobium]|jgi:hypothetical protein|uniref:hypothetical protein n=1 Tax=Rhizobium sp. BG4 TaxID=2613770 RepID=UPI001029E233|nr:hypothetical protein [Rhizobium sp. BG4]QRM47603.1 hypothetical protein F2982_30505 [Rhizobium sp. BG4]